MKKHTHEVLFLLGFPPVGVKVDDDFKELAKKHIVFATEYEKNENGELVYYAMGEDGPVKTLNDVPVTSNTPGAFLKPVDGWVRMRVEFEK